MSIPDFLTFLLGEVNVTVERKTEYREAFAKQRGWTEKVENEDGKEIDNPVTFKEMFNRAVWAFVRGEAEAGQSQLDKEASEATDNFNDLIE